MADRDNRRSRVAAFASLPATRLGMLADSGNRQSQNVEDVTGATMLDKILASIPASAQGYAGDIAWLYRQGQLRPWRQTAGEHMQEAGNMLPDLDLRRNFAEGGTVDDILSAYSAPVRSWPGEQALDDEARANYAAMHPEAPKKLRPDEAFRGMFLPFRETTEGKHEWAVPGIFMDPADAAKAIHASSGTSLGAMVRPSQLSLEALDEILGIGGAGALTGIMGNMPRVLAKPSAGMTELGIFGGRRGAENLAAKGETRPLQALDMLERLEKEGKSRDEIWAATNEILKDSPYAGAFRGVDKKPRFEIDDSAAKLSPAVVRDIDDKGGSFGSAFRAAYNHPEMFNAYPDMRRIEWGMLRNTIPSGRYSHGGDGHASGNLAAAGPDIPSIRSITGHETQHAAQTLEDFARGGDLSMGTVFDGIHVNGLRSELDRVLGLKEKAGGPLDPEWQALNREASQLEEGIEKAARREYYRRLAGEAEARLVQSRRDLTPEERRSRPPWLDYDIPESQQIVRFGDKGPQMSMSDDASRPPLPMDEASRLARARNVNEVLGQYAPERMVVREPGQNIGSENIGSVSRPGHAYRGMTAAEFDATLGAGNAVKSRGDYSLRGEGTNFADDFASAESYVNFGRDDPRKSGRPTYIVEAPTNEMALAKDGYWKATGDTIPSRAWRIDAVDGALMATPINIGKKP